jgi:hypothetical protein
MKYSLHLPLAFILLSSGLCAQKAATPTPVNPTPNPGRTTTPGLPNNNPNTFPQPNTTNNTGVMTPRPIYISGKVIMEDGTPPPDSVRIEKVCSGNPRPQGYTDSKGRFSFQLDAGIDVMADASDSTFTRPGAAPGTNTGGNSSSLSRSSNLTGCDIRASLPGFRSDTATLSFHDSFDNPNVGSIVLHRIGNVEGTTISMTSLNAPKEAQKAFQKGRDAQKKQKAEEAEKNFRKAVEEYPKYAAAWYELGRVQLATNQPGEAEKSFQQSIAADSKLVSPYIELSFMSVKAREWQKTLEITNRAIRLNPVDFPDAYFYNAVANLNLQNVDAAQKSALEAQKLDTSHRIGQLGKLLDAINSAKKPTATNSPEPKN